MNRGGGGGGGMGGGGSRLGAWPQLLKRWITLSTGKKISVHSICWFHWIMPIYPTFEQPRPTLRTELERITIILYVSCSPSPLNYT